MRPLKPYVLALGGFVAAVFGAIFLGAHGSAGLPTPATAPQPDLQQAKRITPSADLIASRETKPARKTPAPQPTFPTQDFSRADALTMARSHDFVAALLPRALERLDDQRLELLVGVVELRI